MSIEEVRIYRRIVWIFCIIVTFISGTVIDKVGNFFKEKPSIMVYAPEDMKSAFTSAFNEAELGDEYKINITTKKDNADIIVDYSKEDDEEYLRFAYSPFVVSYSLDIAYLDDMKKSGLIHKSEYYSNSHDYEINFKMLVDEVIEEGKWANLGVDDLNSIKIFYPAQTTIYWNDFYDFLLVTVNDGSYPKTLDELKLAEEYAEKFFNSSCTEPVTDFYEQLVRTNGFPTSSFYVFPEKASIEFSSYVGEHTRLFYPTNTVNFNYYVKAENEIAQNVLEKIDDSSFYKKLAKKRYRSEKYIEISGDSLFIKTSGLRNAYNVVEVKHLD